jgi:hypothetical protein
MRKLHLTAAQKAAILELIERFPERPSFQDYSRGHVRIKLLLVEKLPKRKDIPFTVSGFGPKEVKLQDGFDATRHLPAGWAVACCFDSGGNHALVNAAEHLWREIWNYWSSCGGAFKRPTNPCEFKEIIDNLYE